MGELAFICFSLVLVVILGYVLWLHGKKEELYQELLSADEHYEELERRYDNLLRQSLRWREQAAVDPPTGLLNRRAFERALGRMIDLLTITNDQRHSTLGALALLFIDLDHFKRINDTYGHGIGDEVLVAVAGALRQILRESDFIGRYGGEELIVALPGVDAAGALKIAEELRVAIAELTFSQPDLKVTASFGVAVTGHRIKVEKLIEQADIAMYAAKAAGRDQVYLGG